jgi:proteasome assembly chaperone (PAC2) family protein
MLCGWPGIGNIGLIAMDTIRRAVQAKEIGEIEPWEFFAPRHVRIQDGLLEALEFPSNKFYFQKGQTRDLLFFLGERQPSGGGERYAEGEKAYNMASLVLDVAEKFGCRRVYTSGAAVTQIHHTSRSRVWAVPNSEKLMGEVKRYPNTILMSETEGRSEQGVITGLNGLLLGVARKRRLEAVCVMGEIPYYLQQAPWPYTKGSRSVLELLTEILGIQVDLGPLDELAYKVEENIDEFLETLYGTEGVPSEFRDQIERLKDTEDAEMGPITKEEQRRMIEHIDELFDQGDDKDERHL